VAHGIFGADVLSTHADDYAKFDLVVHVVMNTALKGESARASGKQSRHGFIEPHWLVRQAVIQLRNMCLVIATDAHYLSLFLRSEISLIDGLHPLELGFLGRNSSKTSCHRRSRSSLLEEQLLV